MSALCVPLKCDDATIAFRAVLLLRTEVERWLWRSTKLYVRTSPPGFHLLAKPSGHEELPPARAESLFDRSDLMKVNGLQRFYWVSHPYHFWHYGELGKDHWTMGRADRRWPRARLEIRTPGGERPNFLFRQRRPSNRHSPWTFRMSFTLLFPKPR